MATSDSDLDVLLGRLAIHYKLLSRQQVQEALREFRTQELVADFESYLTGEGTLDEATAAKLVQAREQYLRKQGRSAPPKTGSSTRPMQAVPGSATAATDVPDPVEAAAAEPEAVDPEPVESAVPEVPQAEAAPEVVTPEPAQRQAAPASPTPTPTPEGEGRLGWSPRASLEDLLREAKTLGASDLHVHAGATLKLRLHGRLVDASPILPPEETERLILGALDPAVREQLEERLQADFSFEVEGVGRFRANAYRQQRGLDAVYRIIAPTPPTLEDLGLPADLEKLTSYHQGIVLFTGPAGCGKSSTMAAMIRLINQKRPDHVLVIEDPIEYVHTPARCVVNQREVGPHTESFARALRAALREDPDVIGIGELRDLETISLALTAAETGHLVLGTLHTSSAIRTLNRLLGVFPPDQQSQIRTMISESLRAIVSQRLVVAADGSGRIPAIEVMMNNKAIGNLIRENRTFQIHSVMQTGSQQGNILLDASLAELVKSGRITKDEARRHAEDPKRFA